MQYNGSQFRAARAAIRKSVREVRDALGFSNTTLFKVEAADVIEIGEARRQAGTFEAETIKPLVAYYQSRGVQFLPETASAGPGIRLNAEATSQHPMATKVKSARVKRRR